MIREVAELKIHEGADEAFLQAVEKAVPIFQDAHGCLAMRLEKVIESPELYRLIVLWERLEDHTKHFTSSKGFQDWRALVGRYFAEPPRVDHSEVVVSGFQGDAGRT